MKFKSLNNAAPLATYEQALLNGVAPDNGLYVPETLPRLPADFLNHLADFSLTEIATTIAQVFIDEIPKDKLIKIIEKTFNFSIPLVSLEKNIFLLELFHGPTFAFKDVGARFMAETVGYFLEKSQKKMTILVATSGDTGSAVAHGFYNHPNIDVYILYPSGKISSLQECQMTTLNGNIYAIEIAGTFDDCQQLVKQSLADAELIAHCHLTTANSINMGRLIPQIIYYFWAIAQLQKIRPSCQPTFVVPSGNFGNLTAAAYAKAMGAPIKQLIAATNSNDVVPQFLATGVFQARASKQTLSNAMDVGNPNNFPRLQFLYQEKIREAISGIAISDEDTLMQIRDTYTNEQVMLDPHTAVGVAAAKRLNEDKTPIIVAATAHPGKFPEVIKKALGFEMTLPLTLQQMLSKQKKSIKLNADFKGWKDFLFRK